MKKILLITAIASLSIITAISLRAQNKVNQTSAQNENATVNIVGKKYMCKIDFKEVLEANAQEEKVKTEEEKKKMEEAKKIFAAVDCYMYVTIKNEQKLVLSLKISMNKEKGRAAGLNAMQRATLGTLLRASGRSETMKYIRKGAFLYDAKDPSDDEPIEIINGGKALRVKDPDMQKAFILKEIK